MLTIRPPLAPFGRFAPLKQLARPVKVQARMVEIPDVGRQQEQQPLSERLEARFGDASLAAAELAAVMQNFVAISLPALYTPEADPQAEPAPRRSLLHGWLAPEPRPSYF